MAKDSERTNDQIEKSRLQSAVLDYKRSKKLVKCGIIAISVIAILLLIFLTSGWSSYRAGLTDPAVNGADGKDGDTPYIGENGNWWIGETDTGISAAGKDGAAGADGADGATPYIGENGNWWIGDKDTGVPAGGGGSGSGGTGPTSDGSFTIKLDPNNGEKSISMSETPGFANPVNELKTNGLNNAWNITYADIPVETIDSAGGANNGANYFAYTFYVKNTGVGALNCKELLTLTKNDLDAVKAIRVMVFRNGESVRYASPAADGEKEAFACDESFTGDVNLIEKSHSLAEGEMMRYTIVVWFEGEDPECVNAIKGGSLKLDLTFSITE